MNTKRRSLLVFETSSVLLNLNFFFFMWEKIGGRGGGRTAIYANNRYMYPYMGLSV